MSTQELMAEIEKLPLSKRMRLLQSAIRKLERATLQDKLKRAAEDLRPDYLNDNKLTSLSALDLEDFYEAR